MLANQSYWCQRATLSTKYRFKTGSLWDDSSGYGGGKGKLLMNFICPKNKLDSSYSNKRRTKAVTAKTVIPFCETKPIISFEFCFLTSALWNQLNTTIAIRFKPSLHFFFFKLRVQQGKQTPKKKKTRKKYPSKINLGLAFSLAVKTLVKMPSFTVQLQLLAQACC